MRRARLVQICSRAFTLVELLVVIAIIGILMGLTLPAIQGARETARMTQCMNNMNQLSKATAQYESKYGQLPHGGWGPKWIGMPPYVLEKQPGGWIYQLLPYAEEEIVATKDANAPQTGNVIRAKKVIPWLYCPTRRAPSATVNSQTFYRCGAVSDAGRTDYAACATDGTGSGTCEVTNYPNETNDPNTATTSKFTSWGDPMTIWTGAVVQRRGLRANDIQDGRSKTLLYGEKAMSLADYDAGTGGDQYPALSGFGNSIIRTTATGPVPDSTSPSAQCGFGSAHPAGSNFVFCDGTGRVLDNGIDATIFRQLGNRKDNQPVNDGSFIQ